MVYQTVTFFLSLRSDNCIALAKCPSQMPRALPKEFLGLLLDPNQTSYTYSGPVALEQFKFTVVERNFIVKESYKIDRYRHLHIYSMYQYVDHCDLPKHWTL